MSEDAERQRRLSQVLETVIRRRDAGESVPDEKVLRSHPDLAPELAERLAALRKVEEAERRAREGSSGGHHAGNGPLTATLPSLPGWLNSALSAYKVVGEIHRGGQGVVYRARQIRTGRDVAIKVLRAPAILGRSDKARFHREVKVLGQLRHPNIVTIHDSGGAEDIDYFVMDFIEGRPLDVFLAGRQWSVRDVLQLFRRICEAVNAAHLRGVIHRDLKPGNILIDDAGEPHILDFGLAKLSESGAEDETRWRAMTMTGQFVGSLPWASPEQAEGRAEAIDLRTDVYSLGVILFQMLTGRFPYPVDSGMPTVMKHIAESEPIRPSSLRKDIDEDVDTIVLKCLAKEPGRRYQSAAALADDVERYLSHQPLLARAPSTMYQVRKLIARHRLPFAFLVTLVIISACFSVGLAVMYQRTAVERNRAVRAEQKAERERAQAVREAQTAKAIRDFLVRDLLTAADPAVSAGRKVTVEEVVTEAARRVDTAFPNQPLTEASVRSTLARVYESLGLYSAAVDQLRAVDRILTQQLGPDHAETLSARLGLSASLGNSGRFEEAAALSEQTLRTSRRLLGEDHELTLRAAQRHAMSLRRLGQIAASQSLLHETLLRQQSVLGKAHPATLATLREWTDLALRERGLRAEAEAVLREGIEAARRQLGPADPSTLSLTAYLATILHEQRRFEEAEELIRAVLGQWTDALGPEHPYTLGAQANLAEVLKEQNKGVEAERMARDVVELSWRALGEAHPVSFGARVCLGRTLHRRGKYGEAAAVFQDLLEHAQRSFGDQGGRTINVQTALSDAIAQLGRFPEAEDGFRAALHVYRDTIGGEGNTLPWLLRQIANVLAAQNRAEEARPYCAELLAIRRRAVERAPDDPYLLNSFAWDLLDARPPDLREPVLALLMAQRAFENSSDAYHYSRYTLARAYEANDRMEDAIVMARRALSFCPPDTTTERREYEALLVRLLESTGDRQAAEQVYLDTLEARRTRLPPEHPDVADALEDLAVAQMRYGKSAEAETALHECLAIRRAALPEGDWRIGRAMGLLGDALFVQGRIGETEPLMLEGLSLIEANEWHPLHEAARLRGRIAALYEATGRPDRAETFRNAKNGR